MNLQDTKLKDLDLFFLLRLEHLSAEEKAQRIAEIQEIVLIQFAQDDLPKLLSPEDLNTFELLVKDPSNSKEIDNFLRSKIPDIDKIILEKMLTAKKEIVRQNILTRLDVNSKEASDPEVQRDPDRKQKLYKERESLNNIISAINKDDWGKVSELVSTL